MYILHIVLSWDACGSYDNDRAVAVTYLEELFYFVEGAEGFLVSNCE